MKDKEETKEQIMKMLQELRQSQSKSENERKRWEKKKRIIKPALNKQE